MAQVPAYPEALKDAAWQKTKGIIAKITAPPTKLGEFARSTQAAYAAVGWDVAFGVPTDVGSKLADVTQQQMDAAGIYKTKIKNLQDEIVELKKQAITVRTQWAANKAIPKPQKDYIAKMVLACDALSSEIEEGWKAALAEFELLKKKIAFRNPAQAREAAVASNVLVTKAKDPDKAEPKLKFKTPPAAPATAKTAPSGIPAAPPSPAAKGPSSGVPKPPASSAGKPASSGIPAAPPARTPPATPAKPSQSSGGRSASSTTPVPPPRPPAAKGPTSATPNTPPPPATKRP